MKSEGRAKFSRPRSASMLAIFIVGILVVSVLSLTRSYTTSAYAAQKTETVTGDIVMVLDKPITPTEQVTGGPDGSSGGATLGTDKNSGNNQKAAEPSTINKVLAVTGDYLPYILVALALSSACVAGIVYIARRNATGKEVSIQTVANMCFAKKAGIVILATLLISGLSIAIRQAVADENKDSTASSHYIAKVQAKIVVDDKGDVKAATVDIKNNCKSNLRTVKFSNSGEFAKLVNAQISPGEVVQPGKTIFLAWTPIPNKINAALLAKLKKGSGIISDTINVDVSRDIFSVKFAMNDTTEALFSEQEIPENENATIPIHEPLYKKHRFTGWNTKADGSGENVNSEFLEKHPITSDVIFYAQWKKYVGPEVFLAKKSNVKTLPCKIFAGEAPDEEIIPIEKVAEAADRIKRGDNPDPDIYDDTSDKWHLFVKIAGNGDKITDWMESRIIHVGAHDIDGSAITFQAVHCLEEKLPFASSHKKTYARYYGDWSICSLKEYLNQKFFDKLPASLKSSIRTIAKRSNRAAGVSPNGGVAFDGLNKIWLISYTEFVGLGGEKSKKWDDSIHDGSVYNFWKRKNLFPFDRGMSLYVDAYQKSLVSQLCTTRDGMNRHGVSEPKDVACWMRSLAPGKNTNALTYDARGIVESDEGRSVDTENFVTPCFAL